MSVAIKREGADWRIDAHLFLPAPIEEIFDFFSRAENLEKLTPSFLRFRIVTPLPIEMRAGALIDYALRVRGLPIRWRTRIDAFEPPRRFADTQLRGPYAKWEHEHLFAEHEGGTLCRDVVLYRPRGGWVVNRFFVERDVRGVFGFRARALREMFSGSAPAPPASVEPAPTPPAPKRSARPQLPGG